MTVIGQHTAFLLELRKNGKANMWTTSRARIMNQLYNDFRWAFHSGTLSYKEYRKLIDNMRYAFSYESLLGVKQLSVFDNLTDEQFVDYIEK